MSPRAKLVAVLMGFVVIPFTAGAGVILSRLHGDGPPQGPLSPGSPVVASGGKIGGATAVGIEATPELVIDPDHPQVAPEPAPTANAFAGKSPRELALRPETGAMLQGLVAPAQAGCLQAALTDFLPALQADVWGALRTSRDTPMEGLNEVQAAFVTVSPGGDVSIVLQCAGDMPDGDSKKVFRYYTNEGIGAIPTQQVVVWLKRVGKPGDAVIKSDGKAAAELSVGEFLGRPGARVHAAPHPEGSAPFWAGEWNCETQRADAPDARATFRFGMNGRFSYSNDRVDNLGSYRVTGTQAAVRITRVRLDGKHSFPADVRESIQFANDGEGGHLAFNLTQMASDGAEALAPIPYECTGRTKTDRPADTVSEAVTAVGEN